MIDWINDLCRQWGDARYRIDNCKTPPTSIFGRIKDGWSIAAAQGQQRPDPPEVMLDGALMVSVAIRKAISSGELREREFQTLYVHYADRAPAKRKAYALRISRKRYYEIIHRCHRVLRRNLEGETQQTQEDACQGDNLVLAKSA